MRRNRRKSERKIRKAEKKKDQLIKATKTLKEKDLAACLQSVSIPLRNL